MISIDERSIRKLIENPNDYLLCLRGTLDCTICAERKGVGTWIRSQLIDRNSYDLANIIFRSRKNKNFSDGFIATVNALAKKHNAQPGQEKILTLTEQTDLYKEWQKVVIKFLIEKLKRGAVLELTLKDGRTKYVEFSHFYEDTFLYCYALEGQAASMIRYGESDLRSIKIVAYAMSQWHLICRTILPGVDSKAREYLKSRGVEFRDRSKVVLPHAWKKVPREHPLWIDLVDEEGKKVGELFHRSEEYEEVSKFHLTRPTH